MKLYGARNLDHHHIRRLVSNLHEQHRRGNIPDKVYKELKLTYEARIKELEKQLMPSLPRSRKLVGQKRPVAKILKVYKGPRIASIKKPLPARAKATTKLPKMALRTQNIGGFGENPDVNENKIDGETDISQEDLKNLLSHLEEGYKEGTISEETYAELAGGYRSRLSPRLDKPGRLRNLRKLIRMDADAVAVVAEKPEEPEKEPEKKQEELKPLPQQEEAIAPAKMEELSLIKRIFRKTKKKDGAQKNEVPPAPEAAPTDESDKGTDAVQEPQDADAPQGNYLSVSIEVEKIKAILDTIRETKKSTDETIQNIFESVGEIRSMVFQNDANLKEITAKMERLEDQVTDINPTSFSKKINEINSAIESHNMFLEKLDKKSTDLSEKINTTYTTLRTIGGIENLAGMNKELQKKLNDIHEMAKYIERISVKAEKTYIDLNERLGDFILYKSKQDSLDENIRDLLKSVDRINLNFENFATKKDLESFRMESSLLQSQIQELNKALPIIQLKLPEEILHLKREREDILLFLKSLKEQMDKGKVSKTEYESIKAKNDEKLSQIEKDIGYKWSELLKSVPSMEKEAKEKASEDVTEKPGQDTKDKEKPAKTKSTLPDNAEQKEASRIRSAENTRVAKTQ